MLHTKAQSSAKQLGMKISLPGRPKDIASVPLKLQQQRHFH